MKKIISILIIMAITASVMCLTGCGRVTSSYRAVGFVHSNTYHHAFAGFFSLEGRYVMRLKVRSESGGTLYYKGELGTGKATVYCISPDQETELFTLTTGGSVESTFPLPQKGRVYIIIQTDGVCEEGSFVFDIL